MLVILDTNAYIRLAKRIRPLLGINFGRSNYVLAVLKDVENEVHRSATLSFKNPWFDQDTFRDERYAKRLNFSAQQKAAIENTLSILLGHVASDPTPYMTGGRSPPSNVDCRMLAVAQVMSASVVVTDDLGMHLLATDFRLPLWHGWELLAKLRTAKMVNDDLVREIFEALEVNGDLTATWSAAKHGHFKRIFGNQKGQTPTRFPPSSR